MYTQSYNELTRDLIRAQVGKIRRLRVPKRTFFVTSGTAGLGSPDYAKAFEALFSLAYAVKFLPQRDRTPDGYEGYIMAKPEGIYSPPDAAWSWKLLLPQPDFVTEEVLAMARATLRDHGDYDWPEVQLKRWEEGDSIQTLHVGPYSQAGPAIELLERYIAKQDFIPGRLHEIYLNDRRVKSRDKARTVIRFAISALKDNGNGLGL